MKRLDEDPVSFVFRKALVVEVFFLYNVIYRWEIERRSCLSDRPGRE